MLFALFGIVPMFECKDFVPDCFVAQICAIEFLIRALARAHAHFGAYLRDEAITNKILWYERRTFELFQRTC